MENVQSMDTAFYLNYSTAEEGATAAKRCLIINTAGLNNLFILKIT